MADDGTPQRFGEVVETSTTQFLAQCYELNVAPPLGSLVRVGDAPQVYAITANVETTSLEPGRTAIALGQAETSEEDVYRHNPQLPRLLNTRFQGLIVGYVQDGAVYQRLPPSPPRLHSFAYLCAPREVLGFTQRLDFLPILLGARVPAGDQVAAACLRLASAAHEDPGEFRLRAGKALVSLLSSDLPRLNVLLRGLAG